MITLVDRVLHHAYGICVSHFLLTWLLFLGLIVACGLSIGSAQNRDSSHLPWRGLVHGLTGPRLRLRSARILSAIGLLAFLACYIGVLFVKADFAEYDDDQLIDFSLQGNSFPPPVWPGIGRFFPLGHQEFNLLRFITKSPFGYHSFPAAQLIIFAVVLLVLLRECDFVLRVVIIIAAMLTPSFVISFTWLICPERNLLFWMAIILLCRYSYANTQARFYFIGCLVATHFALYYKETVVVFVVVYAVARLLLQANVDAQAGRLSWQTLAKRNSLEFGMLAVSGVYGMLFLLAMLPYQTFSYVETNQKALSFVLLQYLQIDWLPFILIPVLVVRFSRFIFHRVPLDPMWDSVGIAAFISFLCVIALRLYSGYYTALADLGALLYLARMSLSWLSRPTTLRICAVIIVLTCTLIHNVVYSSFSIFESKSLISLKSQLADFLRVYERDTRGEAVTLFFPYAKAYHLMGLSAYLRYKGFQLSGQQGIASEAGPTLVVEGHEAFANSRCVEYRGYACIHADRPPDGALIIILPDDKASMADVDKISKDSVLLFSSATCAACSRPGSLLRRLHAISPFFADSELPGHWLQLHVFLKPYASAHS